jgi:hypothetical protein
MCSQGSQSRLFGRSAVERHPPAPSSDALDLAGCLTTVLPEGAQEIVGHIRRNPVAYRAGPVEIGQQKPLHLLARRPAGKEEIHHPPHVRTAMGSKYRRESHTIVAATPPPARRLRAYSTAHDAYLSRSPPVGKRRARCAAARHRIACRRAAPPGHTAQSALPVHVLRLWTGDRASGVLSPLSHTDRRTLVAALSKMRGPVSYSRRCGPSLRALPAASAALRPCPSLRDLRCRGRLRAST